MGFFSTLFGGSESETEADKILQSGFGGLPGFDAKTGTETLQGIATDRLGQSLDPFDIPDSTPGFDFNSFLSNSAFGNPLQSELSSPNFGPQNPNEQALINSLISQVQGNSAVRGLDPSFGSIAQTIAPELIDFQSDQTAQAANIFTSLLGLDKQDTVVGGGRSTGSSQKGIIPGLASLKSDRRLKKNIIKLGEYIKGINFYSFEYLWSPVRHFGFMADEVKKIMPEAVVTGADGFDSVYYDKVVK